MSDREIVTYEPKNLGELKSFCDLITKTNLVPTAYKGKPEDAMVAIMFGKETGNLGPLTSLQFIAVINGRPGYYSDAVPGVALNKGMILDIEEFEEGQPYEDTYKRVCVLTKANGNKVRSEFSVADARQAGLWDKAGPWKQYPKRMLQWRARGFGVRDAAPNLLFGNTVEELQEIAAGDRAKDITPSPPPSGSRLEAFAQQHLGPTAVQPALTVGHDGDGVVHEVTSEPDPYRAHALPKAEEQRPDPAPKDVVKLTFPGPENSRRIVEGLDPEEAATQLMTMARRADGRKGVAWCDAALNLNPWISTMAAVLDELTSIRETCRRGAEGK